MSYDIRNVKNITNLITYFSQKLEWNIDIDDFEDIDDISYDFDAEEIGLKEEAFAKIESLKQLQPFVDGQKWGIFCVEFDSDRFEISALRKILSGLIPKRRNATNHAVWNQQDLLFLCTWRSGSYRTIGIAHFEDKSNGLPQIKMISCVPEMEDFTQIKIFEDRLSYLMWPKNSENMEEWREIWSSAFTTGYRQTIRDTSTLTNLLAVEAQNIRNRILDIIKVESSKGYVHLLCEKFRDTLIHDMTVQQFADMYAQTVVYGLFSARCMDDTQENFSADEAIECIPNTNPFLKSLMKECVGAQNNSKLSFDELEICNVIDLLRHTKTDLIIQDFNRQTGGGREDPVIHFYEEFLTAYDKAQKIQRGVFYTPQPVVNFIVSAVDYILKSDFNIKDGLASEETKTIKIRRESKKKVDGFLKIVEDTQSVPAIQVLDPATGTGTFVRQVIIQIYNNFIDNNRDKAEEVRNKEWNSYVDKQLLPRINGFELMMAPYAVAHMKLAMVLKDTGYDFKGTSRLNIYLTNSLEEPGKADKQMTLWDDPLATESIEANIVKKNSGINVVLGNPPYSTESSNKGDRITKLMDTYKTEADGRTKLKEKNSKPLNDDYIKFIRYGQHVLNGTNQGIVAFINPHGFVDGPIYRGMRTSLMRDFKRIYILDLHGNANRREVCPDGSKDDNVFDIKQGVCIIFLEKQGNTTLQKAEVYKADLWGTRDYKYDFLNRTVFSEIQWTKLNPMPPLNNFFSENTNAKSDYENGIAIRALFDVNGTGVLTKRDKLCIHFSREDAFLSAKEMMDYPKEYVVEKYRIPEDVRDWKYEWAKEDVEKCGISEEKVLPISYRPFDRRYVYYTGMSRGFIGWPVYAVMQHMINEKSNIALVTARSNKAGNSTHFYVSKNIVEYKCGERTTNSSVFPLYKREDGSFQRTTNFKEDEVKKVEDKLGLQLDENSTERNKSFTSKDLFAYLYAILYCPEFRRENEEFLNRDFPIIPYPTSNDYFWKMVDFGNELISIHLYKEIPEGTEILFRGEDRKITTVTYQEQRVYINKTAYFDNISEQNWCFNVGGYQPAQRWLKERKGRNISSEDIKSYKIMINVFDKTQEIMKAIDKTYVNK